MMGCRIEGTEGPYSIPPLSTVALPVRKGISTILLSLTIVVKAYKKKMVCCLLSKTNQRHNNSLPNQINISSSTVTIRIDIQYRNIPIFRQASREARQPSRRRPQRSTAMVHRKYGQRFKLKPIDDCNYYLYKNILISDHIT